MLRFRLPDGLTMEGRTYQSIVQQMASTKFDKPNDLNRYRKAVAQRARALYHAEDIEVGSNRSFILSLVRVGLLEPV